MCSLEAYSHVILTGLIYYKADLLIYYKADLL